MGRAPNPAKWQAWRERMERFNGGQLSVTEFCRRERVSAATFYLWRKRLASVSPRTSSSRSEDTDSSLCESFMGLRRTSITQRRFDRCAGGRSFGSHGCDRRGESSVGDAAGARII